MATGTTDSLPAYLNEDIGPTIIATASLIILSCTVFMCLRYWARYLTSTPFGVEDILIPIAWFATVNLCVVGLVMVKAGGTGRHQAYVERTNPTGLATHYKGVIMNEIVQPGAVAFPKICIVLLFLRVFTNKWERLVAKALIAIILGAWISYTVAACFQCRPFAYNWDKTIPHGKCFHMMAFANSSSVPNIVTDVIILFLPWRTVVNLKVSIGRRCGLLLIFLMGSVGIVASIVRTVVFLTTNPLVDVPCELSPPPVEIINWTIIEPGLYLLAACALSFKPLFRLVAQYLHLHNFITASKATSTKPGSDPTKSQHKKNQKAICMDAFKSGSSVGFSKIGGEKGARDEEECVGFGEKVVNSGDGEEKVKGSWHEKTKSLISVKVTRTVEVDSEPIAEGDEHGEVRYNASSWLDVDRTIGRAP
ncbi:hypothetical protein P280DRAFT_398855 [Massarina eburnea CBS 473.64]|uniref:Rhodopsin domain-containing protein n=1 Tax=Massarina eburnea CBS 473.64 TaxID=1395130 RepID=A0A6A6S2D2_9PLEO|nr:hypothetical protein P280DRAFT_398855 [Massarina eburnea CBS 473.64]